MRRLAIDAEPLTAAAWEPFGWLPVDDTDPGDVLDLHFEWADPHLNYIAHTFDEIPHADGGAPVCEVMYRHETHTQALLVTNCDAVVAVAPAAVDFSDGADLDTVRAFVLRPGDCFVLHRGTWHWGPFPVGPGSVRLLNVQGRRYAEDNASVDLPARAGAVIEVNLP
ncbi:MAG TPA: ureidoglycolate lyase [Acidimicrobiia bacterium]|nr:ureidoglycolate lyase [Acidimicrobiia bacterium]